MESLYNSYKKYDYLNKDSKQPTVKILVSYIKPSFLFKTDILTPIHLGRAIENKQSKDGIISNNSLKWLHDNCIGDNDFNGNISNVNRRVGLLTGTYWAWKNYDKLGNPKYFGSFGYRRLLNPIFLEKLNNYDIILPKKKTFNIKTIKEQIIYYHGMPLYDNMINILNRIYPNEAFSFQAYLNKTSGYFDEIYVMKKEIFFDFCSWIFPLLFEYLKLKPIALKNNDTRDIGFIMERLTGYYLEQLTQQYKYFEVEVFTTQKFKVNHNIINTNLVSKLRKRVQK